MNLFKNLKNKKGMSGAVKGAMIFLTLAFVIASVSYILPVLANHISTVTITPSQLKCGDTATFTVVVTNNGPDRVREVRLLNDSYGDGDGHVYENIPPHEDYQCGAAPDGWVLIDQHQYGFPYCQYQARNSTYFLSTGQSKTFNFSAKVTHECNYSWAVETYDIHLAWQSHEPPITVDCTPPVTTKSFEGPQYPEDNDQLGVTHWITPSTLVRLDAVDNVGPHDTGINATYYRDVYLSDPSDWHYCYSDCNSWSTDHPGDWTKYTTPFTKDPQSCHVIEYYSVDNVENVEPITWQCVFVDNTPPTLTKAVGDSKVDLSDVCGNGRGWSIPYSPAYQCTSPIDCCAVFQIAHVHDLGVPTESGNVYMEFTPGLTNGCTDTAIFYYSEDGNTWTQFYNQSVTSVSLPGPTWKTYNTTQNVPAKFRYIKIEIPTCMNDYSDVKYLPLNYWVTQNTPIDLYCSDQGDHPVNHVSIWYRIWDDVSNTWSSWTDPSLVADGIVPEVHKTIYFGEDSLHILEAYCVDALGNAGPIDNETFRVDTTPPSINKTMIGDDHSGDCPPGQTPTGPCYVKDSGRNGVHVDVRDEGEICHVDQVSCNYQVWWHTDEDTCRAAGGSDWDSIKGCLIDSNSFSDSGVDIIFSHDSTHDLIINCQDALGNIMPTDTETFLVDSTPPTTEKTYGTPTKVDGNYRWITSDTPITLTSTDKKVGVDKIQWRVTKLNVPDEDCTETCSNGEYSGRGLGEWNDSSTNLTFTIGEDSCHLIEFYANDTLGNTEQTKYQCVFVDNKDPKQVKTVGDPSIFVPGTGCENITYDGEVPLGSGATIDPDHLGSLSEPIVLESGESTEEYKTVTTSEIPIGKLDVLFLFDRTGSMGGVIDTAKASAITIMSNIQSLIPDAQFGVGSFMDYPDSYNYCSYSNQYGSAGCGDVPWVLNNDITNNTGDVTTAINGLTMGCGEDGPESYARALYETQFATWRSGSRKIVIIFEDDVPHDCDLGSYAGSSCNWGDTTGRDPGRDGIVGNDDDLNWSSVVSQLKAAGVSVVAIDSGYAEYSCPDVWQYATSQTDGLYTTLDNTGDLPEKIVESVQNITSTIKHLTLETKPGFENWVTWSPDEYTDVEGEQTVNFNITITVPNGQPGGDYHFYIKVVGDGSIMAVEEIFVRVDEEPCTPSSETFTWVRDDNSLPGTLITLNCDDGWNGKEPHPVDHETLCYKVSFDSTTTPWLTDQYCSLYGGKFNESGDEYCCIKRSEIDGLVRGATIETLPYTLKFTEDSKHDLEFYCIDELGNKGIPDIEYFRVDSTPPVTTKTYLGPFYTDAKGNEFVDTVSTVRLEAIDGGEICAVNNVKTYYRIVNLPDEEDWKYCEDSCNEWDPAHPGDWLNYSSPFSLAESCNVIEFYSEDALGNKENVKWQCVFSDHTAPLTTKWYEGPQYSNDKDAVPTHWINSATKVHLDAADQEPHPSGVKATYYKDIYLQDQVDWHYCDKDCETWNPVAPVDPLHPEVDGWTLYTTPFTKSPESCHIIEYYSVDNVDKVETIKHQCVFVDNTGPTVNKTVGDPKETWAGDDTFYTNLTARCAAGDIDCWKVTLGTTLSLKCNDDVGPHPVDHNKMCFQIELDGDDTTNKYCSLYGGTFNESGDGYCCMESGIENFQFAEESQHDLKVKCTDALGNAGPVDEEKFKVEGCPFDICLSKKWNLVSVPFVLFNNNPSEVFKNISDKIASVWTYDNGQWYMWDPLSGGTLTSIKPGWGYWILAKDDGCFEIAGSLFSPLEVPPSRTLQEGWNLIGYYGNTGPDMYETVIDKECSIAGKPVYCALNSLIDTQEGFPRWSSLWNYFNNGGDSAGWKGLNACISRKWSPDTMEPGKGYWIEMDVQDGYSPATNCIWNSDLKCVTPFI